jgi:hypothetical protein
MISDHLNQAIIISAIVDGLLLAGWYFGVRQQKRLAAREYSNGLANAERHWRSKSQDFAVMAASAFVIQLGLLLTFYTGGLFYYAGIILVCGGAGSFVSTFLNMDFSLLFQTLDERTYRVNVAVRDSERLLEFAASTGILASQADEDAAVTTSTITNLVSAQDAARSGHVPENAADFWVAYARLSSMVAAGRISRVGTYLRSGVLVGGAILFSVFVFAAETTLSDIRELIDQQNAAALQLWSDVQNLHSGDNNPAGHSDSDHQVNTDVTDRTFVQIVEFSRKNTWLLQSAARLNSWFTPWRIRTDSVTSDWSRHLNVSPDLASVDEIKSEAIYQITTYQAIRDYSLVLYKTDTLIYSSLSTYILPTVYALLGAFLYGFRLHSRLIRRTEFRPTAAHASRYFIAAIAGLVIGLFCTLLPTSPALQPLAVAFLVGYAVEPFFSRLDRLVRSSIIRGEPSGSNSENAGGSA